MKRIVLESKRVMSLEEHSHCGYLIKKRRQGELGSLSCLSQHS